MGYKIKKIYVGDNYLVYPQWKVNSNTVAYYPLTDDFNDATGNYNMTGKAGSPSITTLNGVKCLYLNGSSDIGNDSLNSSVIGTTLTVSGWVNIASNSEVLLFTCVPNTGQNGGFYTSSYNGQTFGIQTAWNSGIQTVVADTMPISANTWKYICVTASGGTIKLYQNGTLVKTSTSVSFSTESTGKGRMGGSYRNSTEKWFSTGYASRVIIEKKAWSDQDVKDYYNGTKAIYFGFN